MEIIECTQGSDEWFAARKGKMTASNAQAISAQGKGLDTYVLEICAEYLSSGTKKHFSNEHTERGNELEAEARFVYEAKNGVQVEEVGFCKMNEITGCSPDGLVGTEGMVQFKCMDDKAHLKHLLYGADEIDTKYIWQIQMELYVTGRQWCDYFQYNPNFKINHFQHRIVPDLKAHEQLMRGLALGEKKIKEILTKMEEQCQQN